MSVQYCQAWLNAKEPIFEHTKLMAQTHHLDSSFLEGGGSAGALMRAHDWSTSPLGDPSLWPQALRTIVGLVLNSKFPMFIAWGPELAFLYNDAYTDILGDKHPFALGRPFKQVWSEIWPDIEPIAQRSLMGQSEYFENLPLTMHRKGYAEETWFTFSYSPARDDSGHIAGVYCACTETTEQVLSERHREAEHDRMREMFQQAPGLIAIVREPSHVFEFANDAYVRLVGQRDLIGKSVAVALPEVEAQGFIELLNTVYQSGQPYVGSGVSVKLLRSPNSPMEERFVNFVFQPIRDDRGQVSGIFIEGNDVTDQVNATAALRESELRLSQLANNIPHLAWMANPDGNITWYNDRWYDYTGKSWDEMQGWGWKSVHHPESLEASLAHWQHSLTTGELFEETFLLLGKDGEYRPFFTRVAPLRNSAGEIVQWFGTNTDVTLLEAAQRELVLANRRKDEFLAMLAHELRNPLAPIAAAAEVLKRGQFDENRVRQTSAIIARQVAHMTDIVNDLLDVSRLTQGLVTIGDDVVELTGVVEESVEQVQTSIRQKNLHFSTQIPPGPIFVRGDRTRLAQVFSNILQNAAKYTPEHGHISLSLRRNSEQIEFVVLDDGAGISTELLPHIFDLFTQAERTPDRSQGGLGLGLALVKSIVALHKGSVSVKSEGLGRGSEFIVSLPLAEVTEISGKLSNSEEVVETSQELSFLVVDDNVDAAETMTELLNCMGHRAEVAFNASDALVLARKNRPQILLLDIGLPDIDGYELVRRMRAMPETAHSTIIALTGYGQPEDIARALKAGFDRHLVKPVAIDDLVSIISERYPGFV
jgi:PAS domain S-box-containing protein